MIPAGGMDRPALPRCRAIPPPTPQPDGTDRGTWNGWPSRNTAQPRVVIDDQQRITRIRTPVMDLEGHMTPTHLFYVVQHFAVPEPMRVEDWQMTIDGEINHPVTLTYDNGSENSDHLRINRVLGSASFFCAPYHSWEKGSVENVIGLVRRTFQKKTDFARLSHRQIRCVESALNRRPRKCLNYRTPHELFSPLKKRLRA